MLKIHSLTFTPQIFNMHFCYNLLLLFVVVIWLFQEDTKCLRVSDGALADLVTHHNQAQIRATFDKYAEVSSAGALHHHQLLFWFTQTWGLPA